MQNGNVKYKLKADVVSFKNEVYGRKGDEVLIIADHVDIMIVCEVEKFKIMCRGINKKLVVPMVKRARPDITDRLKRFAVRTELLTIEEVTAGPSRKPNIKPKPVGRGKKKATVPTQQTELFA